MRQSIYFLMILFVFSACKKDDDNNSNNNNNPPPAGVSYENPQLSGSDVSADFFGRITSQNGDNIEGALVEIGNKSTTTNSFGFYQIDNALVDQDYAVIEITAPSFFKQFRSFSPKESGTNMQDIQLIPLAFSGAFQSATGGTVQIPSGGQVVFPAGDMVNPDGSAYSGQVAVATAYLNPTDPSLPSYLPGSLLAVNSDDELATMITYGMAGVELYGSNGQLLQLAEGMTASLEMPIQPEQAAFAPETIPLWFFDETSGIWREDGVATKTGDKYVGDVSHFTFWNCDIPTDYAYLEGSVSIADGDYSLSDFYLQVVRPDGSSASSAINTDGTFSGIVPANEALQMYVNTGNCSTSHFYGDIPAINTGDTYDMGVVEVNDFSDFNPISFSATIVDCEGSPLSGLILDGTYGNNVIYALSDENGQVNFMFPCASGNQINYSIINMDELLESVPGNIEFTIDNDETIELGDLAYCDTQALGQYLTYTEGVNSTTMTDLYIFPSENSLLHLYGFAEMNNTDSSDAAGFIVNALPEPGIGSSNLAATPTYEQYIFYQLDNGNYYKAVFDEDQADVFINSAQFNPSNSTIPEKFDLTISGPVEVYIYNSGNTNIPPLTQYSATATVEYYYWPE